MTSASARSLGLNPELARLSLGIAQRDLGCRRVILSLERSWARARIPRCVASALHCILIVVLTQDRVRQVHLAIYPPTEQEYAIKVLDKAHLKRYNKTQTAIAEKNTLVRLGSGHPGIVRLHWAFHNEQSLCTYIHSRFHVFQLVLTGLHTQFSSLILHVMVNYRVKYPGSDPCRWSARGITVPRS